jgi:hypothetical protein
LRDCSSGTVQAFDFGGCQSQTGRLDLHPWWGELGKDVDRHVAQLSRSEKDHGGRQGDHDVSELQAGGDDRAHHGRTLSALSDAVLGTQQLGCSDCHDGRAWSWPVG